MSAAEVPIEAILAVLVDRAGGDIFVPLSEAEALETNHRDQWLAFSKVTDPETGIGVKITLRAPTMGDMLNSVRDRYEGTPMMDLLNVIGQAMSEEDLNEPFYGRHRQG